MSTTAADQAPAPRPPAPAAIACPRCGSEIRGDQGWCVECGLAARTRMAPTPNWRLPTIAAGAIGLVAIVTLVVAFVVLTSHNEPVPGAAAPVAPTPAPSTAPPVVPPAATTPPAATPPVTTPATTTPAPATTTPAPTATTPPATTPPATTPAPAAEPEPNP